ncbi:pancreatic lipase-related protein 2-like [Galleria mellonella]|uniref:Pancreatic lipase-related protein 2-like n=1 Tax=Galleria mellonella TaxID=7137 RepID=A0ABM3MIF6_GALME|nr:pancreatic lipase-related protein 2-like [Galleria mellonella]
MVDTRNIVLFTCFVLILGCKGQRDPSFPISKSSFRPILRTAISVPKGRSVSLDDIIIRHFSSNSSDSTAYRIKAITRLLSDPSFDPRRPTVLYAHGYIELTEDDSVLTIVKAYRQNGRYNILILDWSNLAFGSYVLVALDLKPAAVEISNALVKLLKEGLNVKGLHFVGHSLGVHLLGAVARNLSTRGYVVPRLTGLDAAYPGFYPPILSTPASPSDASFVDMVHTDGGGYGAPQSCGHVDFWPNGGTAKQPGCLPATLLLTSEDLCSHWWSWEFWSEAVAGEQFLGRKCQSYDSFLRGQCTNTQLATLGPSIDVRLRGNFYLRTAAQRPYSLGVRGID